MKDVTITIGNGNLGRASAVLDGVTALIGSGVAVADKFALGDVLALRSVADAETLGITAAYDLANKVLLHRHISDFYANAGDGAELYVMPVVNTVTMADMADSTKDYAATLLDQMKGRVRLLTISRVAPADYVAAAVDQFDPDVWAAVTKARELSVLEFAKHRPIQIIIEGRDYQGTAATAKDLRTLSSNRVSVVIAQSADVAALDARFAPYAAVGVAAGRLAAISVQRNLGRVKDGPIVLSGEAQFADGTKLSAMTQASLDALDGFGYIFLIERDGKAGYYFNNDHCACALTDDFAYIHRGRPIDKAARLVRQVYLEELLDDIEVDPVTGKMAAAVIKGYQRAGEKSIEINMLANSEISGVKVFVDPDQNILSTDKVSTVMKIVPKGMANEFVIALSYENPLNA